MITLSLLVYLGLTVILIMPFMLRYVFVSRHEKHAVQNHLSSHPMQHGS